MLSSNFGRRCHKTHLHVRLGFLDQDDFIVNRQQGGCNQLKWFKFSYLYLLKWRCREVLNKTLCFDLNNVSSGVSLDEHSRGVAGGLGK